MSERKLLLIDGLNIVRRIWEAIPVEDSPEKAVGATRWSLASFKRALDEHAPTHVLAAFDFGGSTWRHTRYPEYHADRKPMPESMRNALPSLLEQIRAMGIHTISIPEVEADDVIATVFDRWAMQVRGTATILSTDKDLAALIAKGAQVRDHFKNEFRDEAWVQKRFGVSASQMHDLLALTGDSTDNIPGVPGVGEKTAAKWLCAFGNLDAVVREARQAIPEQGSMIRGKLRESLRANIANVRLARELVGFKTDIALGLTWNGIRYLPPGIEPSWSAEPSI